MRVVPGSAGTFWVRYEAGAMFRVPESHLEAPTPGEVRNALWKGHAAVISYLLHPDKEHPANSWHYVCADHSYSLDKLTKPARRDARRAQRSLRIAFMDWPTLLDHGLAAFSETRSRVGLSDGTEQNFRARFGLFSRNPAHQVIGAWKEDVLVAFMTLITAGDVVQIEGSFSMDAHRGLCPNNGLVHYVLEHFLTQRTFRFVDYGVSSVQEGPNDGLHFYKKRVGFEARPVHRSFVLHPLLRPFANRLTLYGMGVALRFKPRNRRLKKAYGMLGFIVNDDRTTNAESQDACDE